MGNRVGKNFDCLSNMDPISQEQSEFLTILNDDCINEVLKRLSLNDLCMITHTCSKLRKMAQIEFQRSYPQKNH